MLAQAGGVRDRVRYVALVDTPGEQDVGQGADREHWHVLAAVRRPCTGNARSLQPKTDMHTAHIVSSRSRWREGSLLSRKDDRGYICRGQRVAERLKAKRRNFVPLCDYADENHRDVFHARGDLPPLIPSPRLARFRPVYDPLERGEDERGRKEGKVGWYFGRNGRRTPSARASPAIGMKRERRFPE